MIMPIVLSISFLVLLNLMNPTLAWYIPATFLSNSQQMYPQPSFMWKNLQKTNTHNYVPDPIVRYLTTIQYNNEDYISVRNLSLSYYKAEKYCNHGFTHKMHLVSVNSELEWKMLSNIIGTSSPEKFWLGGIVEYMDPHYLILRWADGSPAKYHRFSRNEKTKWRQEWPITKSGCITGELIKGGYGNWSIELSPCDKHYGIICKKAKTTKIDQFHFGGRKNYNIYSTIEKFFTMLGNPLLAHVPHQFSISSRVIPVNTRNSVLVWPSEIKTKLVTNKTVKPVKSSQMNVTFKRSNISEKSIKPERLINTTQKQRLITVSPPQITKFNEESSYTPLTTMTTVTAHVSQKTLNTTAVTKSPQTISIQKASDTYPINRNYSEKILATSKPIDLSGENNTVLQTSKRYLTGPWFTWKVLKGKPT